MFMDESLISQKKLSQKTSSPVVDDNISELLLKIVQFTKARQKQLIQNIRNVDVPGFTPKDLPIEEFAATLDLALDEHASHRRLLFCDTENVSFGQNNTFETSVITDNTAKMLLQRDKDKYLQRQIDKLTENTLNQRIAFALLGQKPRKRCFGRLSR